MSKQLTRQQYEELKKYEEKNGITPQSDKPEKEVVEVKINESSKKQKKGGCGTFFAGFCFAFIFLLCIVGGGGAYCYYCVSLNDVQNLLGMQIPVEGDIKTKPLKDVIGVALKYKDDVTNCTLKTLQNEFDIDLPTTIPGTQINISFIYGTEINFKGAIKKVEDLRIQDIANNLNEFVELIIPKIYDTVTIQEITSTLQITDEIIALNYPIVKDAYFNLGTTANPINKTLFQLTIQQFLDQVDKIAGQKNITLAEVERAIGSNLIPTGVTFAPIRSLKIQDLTTDKIMETVNGAMIAQLVDLSDFSFTTKAEFQSTTLNNMVDYLTNNVTLKEVVTVPANLEDCNSAEEYLLYALRNVTFNDTQATDVLDAITTKMDETVVLTIDDLLDVTTTNKNFAVFKDVKITDLIKDLDGTVNNLLPEITFGDFMPLNTVLSNTALSKNIFASISGEIKLSALRSSIANLKINQILSSEQIITSGLSAGQQNMTMLELLSDVSASTTLGQLLNGISPTSPTTVENLGGYISILETCTIADFKTTLSNTNIGDLLGIENNPNAVARLADITLDDIANSTDVVKEVLTGFETLGDLLGGQNPSGIYQLIAEVNIQNLLNDPENAITTAINSSTMDLGDLLQITTSSDPIMSAMLNIRINDLFGDDPADAIKSALSANNNTLGNMFGITDTTGIMSFVKNVKMSDLFGTDPSDAIINAIIGSEGHYTTLGTLINLGESSNQMINIFAGIQMKDLIGEGANPGTAIDNAIKGTAEHPNTIGTMFNITATTGVISSIKNITMTQLLTDPTTAFENVVDTLKLTDLFDADTITNNSILNALIIETPNLTVQQIPNKINTLKLSTIIGGTATGVFTLIDNYDTVTISNLDSLTFKSNITLKMLQDAGLISSTHDLSGKENVTIDDVITAYLAIP